MKIVGFRAENFMKLKAINVTIDPDRKTLIFSGKNGQGKTSALNVIIAAIGGKKLRPDKPIRDGEHSAFVETETDEYTARVDFKLKEDGSVYETLTLKNKDGAKFTSAQGMLDKIIGDLSFDPLTFMRMDKKEQRNMLIDLAEINFDFDKNAEQKQISYDERTIVNRELQNKKGELTGLEEPDSEYLKEEMSVSQLLEKLEEANNNNTEHHDLRDSIGDLKIERDSASKEIEALLLRIESEKQAIKDLNGILNDKECALEKMEYQNTNDLKLAISQSEEMNKRIREANRLKDNAERLTNECDDLSSKSSALTGKIDDRDTARINALKKAKFPIKGLSVDEKEVFWGTVPLKQASSAEQLEISISIAMAKNPRLPIVLVTDGSLLDSDHLKKIEELADKHGFNVLIEKVDESKKIGIVIENGEIAKNNYEK